MCRPLNPMLCPLVIVGAQQAAANAANDVTRNSVDLILAGLNTELKAGIKAMATMLAGWILAPSTPVCPYTSGDDWMSTCATGTSSAAQLRSWMLPLTILVATIGILWQAISMTITRKGEPLLLLIKGLGTVALWSAAGIAGTQLALRAGDSYAFWILQQTVFGDSPNPVDTTGTAIADLYLPEAYATALVLFLLWLPILLATIAQIILMIFREGAVVILAGQLQLAAAGSFTKLTSGWLAKVTGWMLALIAYKPIAASIYAAAFLLLGDHERNLVMGLAMLVMALAAMPALMKLFNWSVGSLGNGGGGAAWMLGTSLAAGLHAATALRAIGGYKAADQAAYLERHGPDQERPQPEPDPTGAPPSGSDPGASLGPNPGGAPPSGPGPDPAAPNPGGASTAEATNSTANVATSTTATTATSVAAGAASAGTTLAAQAAVHTAEQAAQTVQRGAQAAGAAMQEA